MYWSLTDAGRCQLRKESDRSRVLRGTYRDINPTADGIGDYANALSELTIPEHIELLEQHIATIATISGVSGTDAGEDTDG